MISAEQIPARFRRFRQIVSKVLFIFHHEKPKPPVVPADDEPDEFQIRQAVKLTSIFERVKASGGTTEVNGVYIIPSVREDTDT